MKFHKTISNHGDRILISVAAIILFLFVGYYLYLGILMFIPETSPHTVIPNQSTIVDINGGGYKQYTHNYFSYTLEYPSEYSIVENQPDFRDGYNRRTHLYLYDGVVAFQYFTDRTIDQEIESIKKGNNYEVTFTDSTFKGLESVEVSYKNYPKTKKILVQTNKGLLMIESYHDPKTSQDWIKQYAEDYQSILSSFKFLD